MNKNIILTILSVFIVILVIFGIWKLICIGVENSTINMEEQIETSKSNIEIILQKRIDELTQLINTVKDSKKFEAEALEKIIQARTETQNGNIEQSNVTLKAVAEQYPELKTMNLYNNVMTATSVSENQLKQYRESYNNNVKNYRKHVRKWPNSSILNSIGYEIKDYKLFTANESAINYNPAKTNLWED